MNTILQKRIEEAAENIVEDYNHYQFLNDGTKDVYTQSAVLFMLNEMAQFILNNQWISVEEALPEEKFDDGYQFVFVRIHLYDDTFYYDTDYIRKGKWELHKNQKITHWMPIPQLKGGEK